MLEDKEMLRRLNKCLDGMGRVYEIEDVVAAIRAGTIQWWQEGDLVTITQIQAFPRKKVLHCLATFGRWTPEASDILHKKTCEFGRAEGCTLFTTQGRKGWSKTLGAMGWKTTGITLEIKL